MDCLHVRNGVVEHGVDGHREEPELKQDQGDILAKGLVHTTRSWLNEDDTRKTRHALLLRIVDDLCALAV